MVKPSANAYKSLSTANPILPNVFCADPTSVEYEGRLYVFGTNDHQQYLNAEKNTYEKIKSLVCFSTDDMANWTYHGEINVAAIAPWIVNSWAPSICSRVEKDGLTHFYLYFSNSGCGVGVLTATNPLGPWTDPLGHALISAGTPGLSDCPNPFDPGVCIDGNGVGWLAFGGGVANGHDDALPGSARIVRLGADMTSLDSDIVEIKAPYFFEASELNFLNGTYVYTFNNNWKERTKWDVSGIERPSACSMAYMTTTTPLDGDSWAYRGHYFKNPGEQGLNYSNNHTHFQKYQNEWYLLYHTLTLQEKAPTTGGFRSICVDKLKVDEQNVAIALSEGTRKGVSAIKNLNPYNAVSGTTAFTSAGMWYDEATKPLSIAAKSMESGSWIAVKNVDFATGAISVTARLKGTGNVQVRLDSLESDPIAILAAASEYADAEAAFTAAITGTHDVYLLFESANTCLKEWKVK